MLPLERTVTRLPIPCVCCGERTPAPDGWCENGGPCRDVWAHHQLEADNTAAVDGRRWVWVLAGAALGALIVVAPVVIL